MSVFKMKASTDPTSGTLSDEAVEEEFKRGQAELVDGPKTGVMSS
jgi:hypothetical protein